MRPTLAPSLLVAFVLTISGSVPFASPADRIRMRATGERLAEIEAAIRPARLFETKVGLVLCGEVLRIDRREPYQDSTFVVRARWREDANAPWQFADELVELSYADMINVELEFENALDFQLFFSSRDEAFPPLGGASWSAAMDRALDGEGILGLARGEAPEPIPLSEPGWLPGHLTAPEQQQEDLRIYVERPFRAHSSSLGNFTLLQVLDGLVAAEERGVDVDALWALSRGAANYLLGLRRVLRRRDAGLTPGVQADLDAQRIELYSLRSLNDMQTALGGARGMNPSRNDRADREALLAAVAAHADEVEVGGDALATWTRLLDAPSSTVWPDALLGSPDPSRRAAWALRLVRECPALWAEEDDLADLHDPSPDLWMRPFLGALLSAGSRRLSSDGTALPNPRLRDSLGLGADASALEFLQPEDMRTPLQVDAQRTLALYLQAARPAEELGHAFAEEAFARRRGLMLGLFSEAFGGFSPGGREAAFYTLLEAGPERIIVTPDTLRKAALNIEHYLGVSPAPGTREARMLEDSVLALCLLAGLYGADEGASADRFREALAGGLDIVLTTSPGVDLMRDLGFEPPPRRAGEPEAFADALRERVSAFCVAMQVHLAAEGPEEALAALRSLVRLALNVEEER